MGINRRQFTFASAAGMAAAASGLFGATSALAKSGSRATNSAIRTNIDAIVLGGGASGLQTAWLLEQEGLRVMVLEGRNRLGGRILTLRDQPGYPELGFNSMGMGYGRGIDAAKRAGLELVSLNNRMRGRTGLWIGNEYVSNEAWPTHPANVLPEQFKHMPPGAVINKIVSDHGALEDWTTWTSPENAHLDVSLNAYLKSRGLDDAAIRLCHEFNPYYGSNSHDVSALMLHYNDGFVKGQLQAGTESLAVPGGNYQLPEAMAKLIKGDILLNKEVIAIDDNGTKVTVTCADGSKYEAKVAVSSLPFSTLRQVAITPGLSGAQSRAVSTLGYQPLSMAFIVAKAPFWDEDKLPVGMWMTNGLGAVIPQRFGDTPEEITGLMVQIRGDRAHYWDRMGADVALQGIIKGLEDLRPAAKGKLEGRAYFSWSGERFNGGDFSFFGPGHISGYINEMSQPSGNLFFCGEHTAVAARGLEAAFESAERVALEVLTR